MASGLIARKVLARLLKAGTEPIELSTSIRLENIGMDVRVRLSGDFYPSRGQEDDAEEVDNFKCTAAEDIVDPETRAVHFHKGEAIPLDPKQEEQCIDKLIDHTQERD